MHPMTYAVLKGLPELEFQRFRDPDNSERWEEIYVLTKEQVRDDMQSESPAERSGRSSRVARPGEMLDDNSKEMWGPRSENDLALEYALEPLLDTMLTAEQRVLVRLRYNAQETLQEIADREGTTRMAVNQRFNTIHRKLREVFLTAFGPQEEEHQEEETSLD